MCAVYLSLIYISVQIYRRWGKKMFDSLEKHCRTNFAYASVHAPRHDKRKTPASSMRLAALLYFLCVT